jgi:hypothetical protein
MRCQLRRLLSIGWPMQQTYNIGKPDANHFFRPMRKALFPVVSQTLEETLDGNKNEISQEEWGK